MSSSDMLAQTRAAEHRRLQPGLGSALRQDARAFAAHRGEPAHSTGRLSEWRLVAGLALRSADFVAVALYRLRMTLRRRRIPLVPALIHGLSVVAFKLRIGDDVLIEPGVYVPHGTVVLDGITRIGSGAVLTPWITVCPRRGESLGPGIGGGVFIGSSASVIGDVTVGNSAQIGSGAVVVSDVPANAVVAGVPARVIAENVPGLLEQTLRSL